MNRPKMWEEMLGLTLDRKALDEIYGTGSPIEMPKSEQYFWLFFGVITLTILLCEASVKLGL